MRPTHEPMIRASLMFAFVFAIGATRTTRATAQSYCHLDRSLGSQRMLIVDLRLRSGDTNRVPTATDSAAVRTVGGRPLYGFHVAMLRVALDTIALRELLRPHSGIADVAYVVADTSRHDVPLQVFFSRTVSEVDAAALTRLGASSITRVPNGRTISLLAPDSVVPRIAKFDGVTSVRAQATECVTAGVGR